MKRTIYRLAALTAVGTIALAGCSTNEAGDAGSSAESTQEENTESDAEEESSPSAEGSDQANDSDEGDEGDESDDSSGKDSENQDSDSMKDPAGTHIARTAGLTVTVKDVEQASAKVRSTATGAGGYVSSEETRIADEEGSTGPATAPVSRSTSSPDSPSTGDHTPPARSGSWAQIVVTVPVDELDSTMTKLAEVGTVTQRTSDAEDLTKQYTDTKARVRTMKKSIQRLRTLIDDTDDLDQIVTLEDELSEREGNLESMVSQQKSLEKRTTTAPITVSLVSPEAAEEKSDDAEETGFVAGLKGGWDSFTSALDVGLTGLGALTPFALTGLVVLAPLAWWLRRRRSRRAQVLTEGSAPETAQAPHGG